MTNDLLRQEARQCSWLSLSLPPAATVALLGLAAMAYQMAPSREAALVGLSKFVWLLPLAQGLAAVAPLTGDPVVELHESSPTPFRRTLVCRAIVVTVAALITSAALYLGMHLMNMWGGPPGISGMLNTFCQGAFLIAVAYAAVSVTPTASSASLLVMTAWIFMVFGINAVIGDVLVNRVLLLVLAAVLVQIGYQRLGDSERLLQGVQS
ncbi:hypothetical protein [Austwickia chelonae]|uniref:hypothetical protein n=1 Tax=Austwickia chelonae TaxID=100225 RepID=UPI000E246B81|nr:hypothetical protein [Austwickia chelonae]